MDIHKEFTIAFILVALFILSIVAVLLLRQPSALNVTTETLERPGWSVGIIPHFNNLDDETVSYYRISVEADREDGFSKRDDSESSYTYTQSAQASDNVRQLWFQNSQAPNCLKITTSVTAYDKDDEVYQREEVTDCISGLDIFENLTAEERDSIYPQAEDIDVTLKTYQRDNYQVDLLAEWSQVPNTLKYQIEEFGDARRRFNGDDRRFQHTNDGNDQTRLLASATNMSPDSCVERIITITARNTDDEVNGYGWAESCESGIENVGGEAASKTLDLSLSFKHRFSSASEPQTGIVPNFTPIPGVYYYDIDYEIGGTNSTSTRNDKIYPEIDRPSNPFPAWVYNPYLTDIADQMERDCLQVNARLEAKNISDQVIASSSASYCVQHKS